MTVIEPLGLEQQQGGRCWYALSLLVPLASFSYGQDVATRFALRMGVIVCLGRRVSTCLIPHQGFHLSVHSPSVLDRGD